MMDFYDRAGSDSASVDDELIAEYLNVSEFNIEDEFNIDNELECHNGTMISICSFNIIVILNLSLYM